MNEPHLENSGDSIDAIKENHDLLLGLISLHLVDFQLSKGSFNTYFTLGKPKVPAT